MIYLPQIIVNAKTREGLSVKDAPQINQT